MSELETESDTILRTPNVEQCSHLFIPSFLIGVYFAAASTCNPSPPHPAYGALRESLSLFKILLGLYPVPAVQGRTTAVRIIEWELCWPPGEGRTFC
jgi:hypothetical protein